MHRLLRLAGARLMATTDLDAALHLVRRFPIDIIVADSSEDDDVEVTECEIAARRCHGSGSSALFVRLPPR